MLRFQKEYFIISCILLLIEVSIALFVHDQIIRPYIGDVLVVMLLYALYRTFIYSTVFGSMMQVWLFAFLVEFLQLFKLVELLGLEHNKFALIIIGNTFHWVDLVAYTVGAILVIWIEWKRSG